MDKLDIAFCDIKLGGGRKIEELEKKCEGQFLIVFKALNELMEEPEKPNRQIGFHPD